MLPYSDWSIDSPQRALMATQSPMNGHGAAGSGGSQFDGSLSLLARLAVAVTAARLRRSARSFPNA